MKWIFLTILSIVALLWITNPNLSIAERKIKANVQLPSYELCQVDHYLFSKFVIKFNTYKFIPNKDKYRFRINSPNIYIIRHEVLEGTYYSYHGGGLRIDNKLIETPDGLVENLERINAEINPVDYSTLLNNQPSVLSGIKTSEYQIDTMKLDVAVGYGVFGKIFISKPKQLYYNDTFSECTSVKNSKFLD